MSAAEAASPEKLLRFFRQMTAIRLFEERVNDLYTRALMPGLMRELGYLEVTGRWPVN